MKCSIFLSLSDSSMNDLWLLSGDPAETETMSCDDQWFSYLHLHGFLMATAFGILFPTGFVIARYIRCSKSKLWFYFHFTVQVGNNLWLVIIGVYIIKLLYIMDLLYSIGPGSLNDNACLCYNIPIWISGAHSPSCHHWNYP